MRTINSICFLCERTNANKTNSHILPKFITKSIFGKGKGYQIDVHTSDKHPEIVQDTPKEDFIICEKCEKYFEVLETYIATRMHNRLKDIRYSHIFPSIIGINNKNHKVCNDVDVTIMRLFIYSIIFRSHISSHKMFNDFKLVEDNFIRIKLILQNYISNSQTELLNKVITPINKLFDLIFVLLTSENTGDDTANFIIIHPISVNPYIFVLNKYLLFFSFTKNEDQDKYDIWNNFGSEPVKIGFLTYKEWLDFKNSFIKTLSTISSRVLKRVGKIPYQGKVK